MFGVANKFVTTIATLCGGAGSSALLSGSTTAELGDTSTLFANINSQFWGTIFNAIGTLIFAISQFALMFIDVIQMIVYKFLGISTNLADYAVTIENGQIVTSPNNPLINNPLIKFLLNDRVVMVLRSVFAVAAVLVIVFSIYSIIRGEYSKAANDTDYSVKRIWGRGIRAFLGMTIFPVMFLAIIILVNALLGGFAYAISGGNSSYTLGSQVVLTSAYDANVYRNYANANQRIPIFINFEDPVDAGYDSRYSKEELVAVYDAFSADGKEIFNKMANNEFPTFAESVTYTYQNNSMVNNSATFGKYEKFFCTADQYYVMADFIDYALANSVTYYYKPIVDADIDWKYVSDTVYDKNNQIMTIKYQDATSADDTTYTVSYKASSYNFTSPVQDAMSALSTLLSLNIDTDTNGYRMLDYETGSINKVQWATNKVRVKLSENYNDTTKWTALDQLLLYEFYRYSYNNTFQNYSLTDLINGVDLDLYTITPQYFRTYTKKYVDLYDGGVIGTVINGNYYKVSELYQDAAGNNYCLNKNGQRSVINSQGDEVPVEQLEQQFDDYGDPIYTIDTSACSADTILNNMSAYNSEKSDDEKLGVHIVVADKDGEEAWYSATYAEDGAPYTSIVDEVTKLRYPGNLFYKAMISTKGYAVKDGEVVSKIIDSSSGNNEFNYVVNNPDVEFMFLDANGFWHTPERVFAQKNVKKVSWPSKLVADMKAIYRDLNLSQLIATGEWLDSFNSQVDVDTSGNYVASFDTSLISPQGLVFSEIFLSEIVESDGSTLSKYMFTSKYSDEEIRSMMLALLGEYYYETATTTIHYFIDTFNMLFAPLLEKIMDGEGQPYTEGEVISTQLYTYKAYLASLLLSSDCANFFMEIAKSIIDMYAFGYDILAVQPDDNSFALSLIRNAFYRNGYGMVSLEDLEIDWRQFYEETDDYSSFQSFLRDNFHSSTEITEDTVPLALIDAINKACEDMYLPFADVILNDNAKVQYSSNLSDEDLQYGLKLMLGENGDKTLKEYLSDLGYTYNPETNYITNIGDGTPFYSWQQLTFYNSLKEKVYSTLSDDLDSTSPTTKLGKLYRTAKNMLNDQGTSIPEYLNYFVYYITGRTDKMARADVVLSGYVSSGNAGGIFTEYRDYVDRLDSAKLNYNNVKKYIYDSNENADFDGAVTGFYSSLETTKQFSSRAEFNSALNLYAGGISNSVSAADSVNYKKQVATLDKLLIELDSIKTFAADSGNFEEKTIVNITNFRNVLSNMFSIQKTVDSIGKYFITYAMRMQTTEAAIKDFTVVVNNHSYNLAITMPTAKLAEYVVGAKYLNKLGYNTMFVDDDYTGFLDIGYDDRLPAAGEDVEFVTMKKFIDNLADITVQSFYMSNLVEITDANPDDEIIANIKYFSDSDGNTFVINDKEGDPCYYSNYNITTQVQYECLPRYMQLILQKIYGLPNSVTIQDGAVEYYRELDQGLLSIKHITDEQIQLISTPSFIKMDETSGMAVDTKKTKALQELFNNTFAYLLGADKDYANMTMKDLRLSMINAIYDYETGSKDSADDDARRYLALFNLFCSDFATYQKDQKTGISFITDITSKSIIMRLAGMQNKPEELLVNLEYESLYDDIGFDENKGDYFIVCTFDQSTRMFLPVLMANSAYKEKQYEGTEAANYWKDTGLEFAHTNSYPYLTDSNGVIPVLYPVIAKGVITDQGLPTAIRQVAGVTEFYRRDVVIRNASELNLSQYYMNVENISVSMNIFQRFTNSISKLFTGKTLIEHAYEKRPLIGVSSYVNLPMGVQTTTIPMTSEAVELHYSFMSIGGLSSYNFYSTSKMNFAVLLLAIIVLIPIVLKAMWGVMGRVLNITFYFMISPVMFSTMALGREEKGDGGKTTENLGLYGGWMSKIMKETISVFGYVFALQIFFIIVPFITSGDFDFFTSPESIRAITSIKMFAWVSPQFVNMIIRLIFLICAAYLITLAPPLFAKVMGQEDGIAKGAKVKGDIDSHIKEVQDVLSGKKMVDFKNYSKEQLKHMIPGYELAVAAKDKIQATKAKVVNAVAQVAGTVMKMIPQAAAYADAVKKAGKMYKEQTTKELEAKKALRNANKIRANEFLKGKDADGKDMLLGGGFTLAESKMKDEDGKKVELTNLGEINKHLSRLGYASEKKGHKERVLASRKTKRQLTDQHKETRRNIKKAKKESK